MSLNIYVYDLAIRVAIMASSPEEAEAKLDQGQAQQISMDRVLVSTTEVPN